MQPRDRTKKTQTEKNAGFPAWNLSEWESAIVDFVFDVVVVFVLMVFIVRPFFVAPFQVKQQSMEPNVHDSEYILVAKLPYNPLIGWRDGYSRGDVVVFQPPTNPDLYLIKRVVGVPGDTLKISGGQVYRENETGAFELLDEPYLKENSIGKTFVDGTAETELTVRVPAGEYFVMGDNRTQSRDARTCFVQACATDSDRFLTADDIQGRAWVIFWPLPQARALTN